MPSPPTIQTMVQEVMRYLSERTAILQDRSGCTVHRQCDEPFVAVGSRSAPGCCLTVLLNDEGCGVGGDGQEKAANPKQGRRPSNTVCSVNRKEGKR
jgi:hypothetical protein